VFDPNPIEAYLQQKFAGAKHTRKAATELAQAMRMLAPTSVMRTPTRPARPKDSARDPTTTLSPAITDVSAVENVPLPIARPRKLSIGTGQVF
jgi:hypothetical protein